MQQSEWFSAYLLHGMLSAMVSTRRTNPRSLVYDGH